MLVRELITRLGFDTRQAEVAAGRFERRMGSMRNNIRTAAVAVGGVVFGLSRLVKISGDTETALGQLEAIGVKNLKVIEDAAIKFSNRWSGYTSTEFVSAAYEIRSALDDLSDEAVAKFTDVAALTAKANKASIDEMTGAVATAYGIFKPIMRDLSDSEWIDQFSGGLSKTAGIFRTEGASMAAAISNIGAVASSAGRPMEEQLAIMGQLQMTMSGEEAGVLYKNFILNAVDAGKKLGLEFVNAEGRMKSVSEILRLIMQKYPDLQQAQAQTDIQEAFGSDRAIRFVLQASQGIEKLDENIQLIRKSMLEGTKITTAMAEKVNQGPNEQFAILRQRVLIIARILGKSLTPAFKRVTDVLGNFALALQRVATVAPRSLQILMAVAAAGTTLLILGGITRLVINLATGLGMLGPAGRGAGKALAWLGHAVVAFASLSWLSLGIIGAVAAALAVLAYDIWRWAHGQTSVLGQILGPWTRFKVHVTDSLKAMDKAVERAHERIASFFSIFAPVVSFVRAVMSVVTPVIVRAFTLIGKVSIWLANNVTKNLLRIIGAVIGLGAKIAGAFQAQVVFLYNLFRLAIGKLRGALSAFAEWMREQVSPLVAPWHALRDTISDVVAFFEDAWARLTGLLERIPGVHLKKTEETTEQRTILEQRRERKGYERMPKPQTSIRLHGPRTGVPEPKPAITRETRRAQSIQEEPSILERMRDKIMGKEPIVQPREAPRPRAEEPETSILLVPQSSPQIVSHQIRASGPVTHNHVNMPVSERVTVNVPPGTTEKQARSIEKQVRKQVRNQIQETIRYALNDLPAY